MKPLRRFSPVQALALAFYSRPLYRDVALLWRGTGAAYLVLVLSLCVIPSVLRAHRIVSDYLSTVAPRIVSQLPAITISKGHVSVSATMPYTIIDPEGGKPLVVIDTSGTYADLSKTSAPALLTEARLFIRKDAQTVRTYDVSDFGDLVITRSIAYEVLEVLDDGSAIVLYCVALLLFLPLHAAEAILLSLMASAVSRRSGERVGFQSLLRLSAVAMTPALVFGALLTLLGAPMSGWWLVRLSVSAFYMLFGVRAVQQTLLPLDKGDDTSV